MKEYKHGEWIPVKPDIGERVKIYDEAGGCREETFLGDNSRNKIAITSHNKRALVYVGDTTDVTIEFQDPDGNLIPLNDTFAMPVNRVGGVNYKTVKMTFVDGVCYKSIAWPDAGEFEITKEMINLHLEYELDFDGFNISVME